jgi:outer membrane receptor for ferrienterochelin and colicins
MDLSMGMQNLFNAYQSDFDTGPYRDSNYIYGPARPRTVWVGVVLSSK